MRRARAISISPSIQKVALGINAAEEALRAIITALAPDHLQLHGDETPERVRDVKARFGLRIIKAIGVANEADVAQPTPLRGGRRAAL
jgi:phosphoribosylanthranilate isomerase